MDDVKKAPKVVMFKSANVGKRKNILKEQGFVFGQDVVGEDAFKPYYEATTSSGKPVFNPSVPMARLEALVTENNMLGPCINAYEINIDGTGYKIDFMGKDADGEARLPTSEEKKVKEKIEGFLAQPWPGLSFTDIRRTTRRHRESIGLGYFETIRNAKEELVLLRSLHPCSLRIVKPDSTMAPVKIQRGEEEVIVDMPVVHRRFSQAIAGGKVIFYVEFGAPLAVNRKTGDWAKPGEVIPPAERANELIVFECEKYGYSEYALPRWMGQLPSILGSRRSEEMNLEYFDSGGVPPFIAFLQGGALTPEAKKSLDLLLSGKAQDKNKGLVLDLVSNEGSLDDQAAVKVTFERFGGEQTKDALFGEYDNSCGGKVRRAFRLPPLFVGAAEDYSFASAYASYVVAEAQVFEPERTTFDGQINATLIRTLDPSGMWKLRSKPLIVKDINLQLEAMAQVKDLVTSQTFVDAINEITHMEMKVAEEGEQSAGAAVAQDTSDITLQAFMAQQSAAGNKPTPSGTQPSPSKGGTPAKKPVVKGDMTQKGLATAGLVLLADRASLLLKSGLNNDPVKAMELSDVMNIVSQLSKRDQKEFRKLIAMMSHDSLLHDAEGVGELAACTLAVLAANRGQVH